MNERFVCIKVDREERPDVDAIYMDAVQAMTGRGGWPLNVFTTPEQVPFYAGTYFPPETRHGMPSWMMVLEAVARGVGPSAARRSGPAAGASSSASRARPPSRPSSEPIEPRQLDAAVGPLRADFDPAHGGFGGAPNSRPPRRSSSFSAGERRRCRWTRCARWRRAASTTRSAAGSPATRSTPPGRSRTSRRCSTTTRCSRGPTCTASRSPATTSSGARAATRSTGPCARCGAPRAGSTRRSTRTPRASRAATTSGRWTSCASAGGPGGRRDRLVRRDRAGQLRGRERARGARPGARGPRRDPRASVRGTGAARAPGLDDKRLASWNALMLAALAEAAAVLERDDYREAAVGCAKFLVEEMRDERAGCGAPGRTAARGWTAISRTTPMRSRRSSSSTRRPSMPAGSPRRGHSPTSRSTPSPTRSAAASSPRPPTARAARPPQGPRGHADPQRLSSAALALLRLAALTGEGEYERRAVGALRLVHEVAPRHPQAFGHLLQAMAFYFASGRSPWSATTRERSSASCAPATARTSSWPAERGTSRC